MMTQQAGSTQALAEAQAALTAAQVAVTQAATPVVVGTVVEPGWTTTEFYATVASLAVAVVTLVHPGFSAPPAVVQAAVGAAGSVATGLYAIGRSLRKR